MIRLSFMIAAFLVVLPVEAAKQSTVPNRFGAIAYHRPTQSWGVSYNQPRARDASVEALKQCGNQRCEVIHKFKNGCAALVDGPKEKAAATASGATRDEAETKALKRCTSANCNLVAWACTR
jgi:hypothetical protein